MADKYTGTGTNEMSPEEYAERLAIEKARGSEDRIPARGVAEHEGNKAQRQALADMIIAGMTRTRHQRNQ